MSLLRILESGASAEVAVVGNEGIVGISAFMGGKAAPKQSVGRSAGHGFRLPVTALVQAFEQGGPVAQLLLRYTQALRRSWPRRPRRPCATGTTAWTGNCASRRCSAWTGCTPSSRG
jgi:hypothetical protein